MDGWADLVIFSAVLTTLCRAFWSAAEQLLYQTERLLVRMLSMAPLKDGEGRGWEVSSPHPAKEVEELLCPLDQRGGVNGPFQFRDPLKK